MLQCVLCKYRISEQMGPGQSAPMVGCLCLLSHDDVPRTKSSILTQFRSTYIPVGNSTQNSLIARKTLRVQGISHIVQMFIYFTAFRLRKSFRLFGSSYNLYRRNSRNVSGRESTFLQPELKYYCLVSHKNRLFLI